MFTTLHTQLGGVLWLGVCALAVWKGGRPERLAGLALGAGWLASLAAQAGSGGPVYWPIAAIDVILLLALAGLAWKSPRGWPAWAALFQLVLVASHLAMAVDLRISPRGYVTVLNGAAYAVLACLAFGVLQTWRARARAIPAQPG